MFATRLLWMFVVTRAVIGTAAYNGNQFIFARFPGYVTVNEDATANVLFIGHMREGRCTVAESNGTDYHVQLIGNNSVTQFHLPTDRKFTLGVAVEGDRAVALICTTEVTLSVLQRAVSGGIADAFPVLPVKSLSTKYIVPSVPNNALLGVVAFYNNTNVTVHLNSTCSYPFRGNIYGRGNQLSITLLQGEVLQIASSQSSDTCDLGGTVVESGQSIAVFSGSPLLCYAHQCDGAMSQVPQIETWGTSFIVPLVPNMAENRVRITAGYNGTNITIDTFTRVESIILNKAEIYDEDITNTATIYIRSSHPILVLQIAGDSTNYQVFQAIVPATDAYGTNYLIPDIQTSSMSYTRHVTIITSSNCTSHININERWSVQSTDSQTFAMASFQPSSGSTTFKSNSSACPFGVLVTGLGNIEMYGYFSTPVGGDSDGSLEDSVNLTCTKADWVVKVNTQEIATVFPTSENKNIFMSNAFCPGVLEGGVLVFNVSYNDCNTVIETSNNNTVTFSNYLIEYERDAQTNLASGALWRYNLACVLQKHEIDVKPFLPVDHAEITVQATSKIQGHEAVMKFYTDDTYTNEVKGNPLKVDLGTRVYVQVQTSVPADVKLLVDNCYISTDIPNGNSTRVTIIHNRCEANHFTHIVGHVYKLTRFYFDVFEMPHHHDNLYVACDVSFCPLMDFAPECQSGCLSTHL
ncbi:uncharacterized protein LOC124143786 [Haliotis rufescens]|uniref:uncharacterized protein LOC124143786 n=1 Tax=Haliotis rufescens TaxID=6454 RepID=UPI00201F8C1F|nr:uncharacterized protein LOC124143786 [Haliotis rufescens]